MIYQQLKDLFYNDKVCHVLIAYTIMVTLYLKTRNLKLCILSTVLLSILKEILDLLLNHQGWLEIFKDLLSDLVGIIIAIGGIKL